MNRFGDMTSEEFVAMYNGYRRNPDRVRNDDQFPLNVNDALPTTVDWRQKGLVTPIKNQGQCGSCWR